LLDNGKIRIKNYTIWISKKIIGTHWSHDSLGELSACFVNFNCNSSEDSTLLPTGNANKVCCACKIEEDSAWRPLEIQVVLKSSPEISTEFLL
jgi:hypothetical protein